MRLRCYACDRKLGANPYVADTKDGQFVFVGTECHKHIRLAGNAGWQPPKGGPRLYVLLKGLDQDQLQAARISAAQYARSVR